MPDETTGTGGTAGTEEVAGGGVGDWIGRRLPLDWDAVRHLTNEPVPNHIKKWWFCLGGTPAYCFVILVTTGILLTFNYEPGMATAHESVRRITQEISFGWFVRGIHKLAAHLMILTVFLHVLRVFFTRAYRAPRELNWMVGCLILGTVLGMGFTGYTLVNEQMSYWGVTVAAEMTGMTPGIGESLKRFMLGGETLGPATLQRMFMLHIGLLPTALIGLLLVHVFFIRVHGVTEFRFEGEEAGEGDGHYDFFPDHLLTEVMIGTGLLFLLTLAVIVWPPHMGPPADPTSPPAHIKPEWFFFFQYRILKLVDFGLLGFEPKEIAVGLTGLVGALVFLWPFVDRLLERIWPDRDAHVWVGIAFFIWFLAFTVWEAAAP